MRRDVSGLIALADIHIEVIAFFRAPGDIAFQKLLAPLCVMSFFFQAEDGIRDHCVTGVQTCALPIYFFRKNLVGIHESSGKALRIMQFTTAVGVVVLIWSGITLAVNGPMNSVPMRPELKIGRASCRERV